MNFLQIIHKKTTTVKYLCHFVVTFDQCSLATLMLSWVLIYIYIYIYIERERERERKCLWKRDKYQKPTKNLKGLGLKHCILKNKAFF